jgi:hypothetical protein
LGIAKYETPETARAVAKLVNAAVRIRTLFIKGPPDFAPSGPDSIKEAVDFRAAGAFVITTNPMPEVSF